MSFHDRLMFCVTMSMVGAGLSSTANGQITTLPPASTGINFSLTSGTTNSIQNLTITTPSPVTLFIMVPPSQTWLKANEQPAGALFTVNTATSGSVASATIALEANTVGLTSGQLYSANLGIEIANVPSSQIFFPVTLNVAPPVPVTPAPSSLALLLIGAAFCWIWLRWRTSIALR